MLKSPDGVVKPMNRNPYAQGEPPIEGPWEADRYFFKVIFNFSTLKYAISVEGSPDPLAFLEYGGYSIKNHIHVYAADEGHTPLLELDATNFANGWATMMVSDPERGEVLGELRRHYWDSISCDMWTLRGPELGPPLTAREDSHGLLRHSFTFKRAYSLFIHGRRAGALRLPSPTSGWELDLTLDPAGELDRRLAIAFAAVLLTVEIFT